jgi:hypothetical protein
MAARKLTHTHSHHKHAQTNTSLLVCTAIIPAIISRHLRVYFSATSDCECKEVGLSDVGHLLQSVPWTSLVAYLKDNMSSEKSQLFKRVVNEKSAYTSTFLFICATSTGHIIITCRLLGVTKMTGSSSDYWIY